MVEYKPELGQMIFGNPSGEYAMPSYAESLLAGLLDQFDRIANNRLQHQWARDQEYRIGPVIFRPYCWDEESPQALLPNFQLAGDPVEIRWYKHAKRGLSCNVEMPPAGWAAWHDRVMYALHLDEWAENQERFGGGMTHPDEFMWFRGE